MINFFFEGERYIAFEKPKEVPDELVEELIKCLFFDEFHSNNYDFSYLNGTFDNTVDDDKFVDEYNNYYRYCAISEELYNKIKRGDFSSNENNKIEKEETSFSNKNNKSIKGGNNMEKIDLGQIISMKMVSSLVADDKKEIDIGKLMLLQSMQNNGKIEITDVMKAKMISKLGLDKDTDELPLEKLMLLDMLQSDELDLTKIISVKLMSKLFDEEEKK